MRGGPALAAMGYDEYGRISAAGGLVPVHRELPGDLMTPVSAFRAIRGGSPRAVLLESVAGGERLARYSFLGRDPVPRGTKHGRGAGPAAVHGRVRGLPRLRRGAPVRARAGAPPSR